VIAVGESSGRALQALVRLDPAGFAARELAERAEVGFPPAVTMVSVEGRPEALTELVSLAHLPPRTELLGPVENGPTPGSDLPVHRLTLRAPRSVAGPLVRAVREAVAIRSARKSEGALRVQVDPLRLG
jgi:primosomal protein N' (replication factor Y) (superfamily II helicase)